MPKPPRPNIGKSQSSAGPMAKAAMVVGTILVVAGIGGVLGYNAFFNSPVRTDSATGCPVKGPVARTVVFVDQTDQFSPVQAADIRNQLEAYKSAVPRYGEMVVYAIKKIPSGLPAPLIRACNPGTEADINKLTEAAKSAAKKWKRLFDQPLEDLIANVLKPTASDTSPIIETVQAASVQEFGAKNMERVKKSIILVSDLLQHSAVLSQYGDYPAIDKFVAAPQFKKLRVDLRDVDIDILYLHRKVKNGAQDARHVKFWRSLFEVQGATVKRVYSVSG